MKKRDFWFIAKSFLAWRIAITLIAILAIRYLPLFSQNFFGGKYINYITNPLFYGWANFDGEHYLSIAIYGYKDLQQAFFPAYPYLVRLLSQSTDLVLNIWSGLIISNTLFLGSLFMFWKIVRLDYSTKIAKLAIISLLVFPTSFYFGAVYTESLFLFSSLLTYYLYRKNKYLLSGLVGILMTLTRVYGIFVLFVILIDVLKNKPSIIEIVKQKIYWLGLSILGPLTYMCFCWKNYNDPFAFYNLQTLVGEQRSKYLILLPQVFYRYIVKIIPNLDWSNFPIVFTTILELSIAILLLIILILSFRKIRWDYWIYIVLGYVLPSLTGSFSSLPRYVAVLFPVFVILSLYFEKMNKYLRLGIYVVMAIIAVIAQSLFFRGYFVS